MALSVNSNVRLKAIFDFQKIATIRTALPIRKKIPNLFACLQALKMPSVISINLTSFKIPGKYHIMSFLHLNCHSWYFKIAVISWHFNIYTGNEVTAKGIKGFQDRGISSIVKRMPTGILLAFEIYCDGLRPTWTKSGTSI